MKVILYMAVAVNGYIAKENHDTSWISREDWESFNKISKEIGCIVIGRNTYEIMKKENSFVQNCTYYILTTDENLSSLNEKIIIFPGDPKTLLDEVSKKGFEKICVAGGGKLNSSFLENNFVNEIYLDVEPVILGKGIQLFFPVDYDAKLKLIEVNKLNDSTVQLHYSVL